MRFKEPLLLLRAGEGKYEVYSFLPEAKNINNNKNKYFKSYYLKQKYTASGSILRILFLNTIYI